MPARPRIRFETDLEADEESVLRTSITQAEANRNFPSVPEEAGATWVVTAQDIPGQSRVLMANRVGVEAPLIASTAEELAQAIRALT